MILASFLYPQDRNLQFSSESVLFGIFEHLNCLAQLKFEHENSYNFWPRKDQIILVFQAWQKK